MPKDSVLSTLLFLIYTSMLFSKLLNKLQLDVTVRVTVRCLELSPAVRVTVAESLNREIGKVSEWCDLWRMKLNASKIKTTIVSSSLTMIFQSPPLTIGGTVLKESDDLHIKFFGVTFDG